MSIYNSVATTKSAARKRKSRKKLPSQLAVDSFAAFSPHLNIFDPGARGPDGPVHTITKESWALNARRKAGEKFLIHTDRREFNPYFDIVRNIYGPQHVHDHIENGQISYYTSGRKGLGLLYLDIDAHKLWQTDEYRAKAVLQKLFSEGYYRASGRGQNGYLKIRYTSIAEFNEVADTLEATLKRLFLHLGILCDIEVKGTITTKEKSGRLAKLPFTTNFPCHMRDKTDSWNYRQLTLFKACPVISARRVREIVREIEPLIDEGEVVRFADYKKRLDREHAEDDVLPPVMVEAEFQPENIPEPEVQVLPQKAVSSERPLKFPVKSVRTGSLDSNSENAFERNHRDLRKLAREFFKRHRRLPELEEALDWLKTTVRYSGTWEENETRRAKRVGQILSHITRGFDPKKLIHPDAVPINLRLGKHSWWVKQQFGSGIVSTNVNIRRFDPETMTAPTEENFVPARFIETFLIVADFCLNLDPLANKAVPTARFKKLWECVEGGAPWNQRYFQIVRDRLDQMGVVNIFDRDHEANKAWRWESGPDFPAESWKESQRELAERCEVLIGPCSSTSEDVNLSSPSDNTVHNSLYHLAQDIHRFLSERLVVRPPPD